MTESRKLLGEAHPAVADSLNHLANILRLQSKPDDARLLIEASPAADQKATVGPSDKPL